MSATPVWLRALRAALLSFTLSSCTEVVLISPYDEVVDTRLQAYRDELNLLVKRAANGMGTAAGTYEASKDAYAQLEVKLDSLVQRARLQDVGVGCKLDDETWGRIKRQLDKVAGLPARNPSQGDASGCMPIMLGNVQKNLLLLEGVHRDPAQCASAVPEFPTCLRPAAADDLLSVSNQTIDAVLFAQSALKRHEEKH